jgi:hypothetical protein
LYMEWKTYCLYIRYIQCSSLDRQVYIVKRLKKVMIAPAQQ